MNKIFSIEDIEEAHKELAASQNPDDLLTASMLQTLLFDRAEYLAVSMRRKEPIIIEYYVRESYGRKLEYIVNDGQRKIIHNLTRQKTVDSIIRELLRDLTGSHIIWKQVLAP